MRDERVKCPVHRGGDRNCAIWRDERGRVHAKCWSRGCPEQEILAALGDFRRSVVPWSASRQAGDDAKRAELARRIWNASRAAARTPGETYLRSRGITIEVPPTIRFHPALRHPSGAYAPAMVAAVEHVRTGTIVVAIHRTWLTADGSDKANLKPQKAALSPIAGGAVRLAPASEILALAEGIETALSFQQATRIASWATLGSSNLTCVELPECVREIMIAADADLTGENAAQAAAQRFTREGRKVRIARPEPGQDFNEYLRA